MIENTIGDEGAMAVAEALKVNQTVSLINIWGKYSSGSVSDLTNNSSRT